MAFNVFGLGKLKGRLDVFKRDHPDVIPFLQSLMGHVQEGAGIELKMTDPDGKEHVKRFTLSRDDVETFHQIRGLWK